VNVEIDIKMTKEVGTFSPLTVGVKGEGHKETRYDFLGVKGTGCQNRGLGWFCTALRGY